MLLSAAVDLSAPHCDGARPKMLDLPRQKCAYHCGDFFQLTRPNTRHKTRADVPAFGIFFVVSSDVPSLLFFPARQPSPFAFAVRIDSMGVRPPSFVGNREAHNRRWRFGHCFPLTPQQSLILSLLFWRFHLIDIWQIEIPVAILSESRHHALPS
jgi:hypothetical protein